MVSLSYMIYVGSIMRAINVTCCPCDNVDIYDGGLCGLCW